MNYRDRRKCKVSIVVLNPIPERPGHVSSRSVLRTYTTPQLKIKSIEVNWEHADSTKEEARYLLTMAVGMTHSKIKK